MAPLDARRQQHLERANALFGVASADKQAEIEQALRNITELDLVDYPDAKLRVVLNDVVYPATENLFTKYIAPPFSVLDTRQGYWTARRAVWEQIVGDLSATRTGEYGTVGGGGKTMGEFGADFRNGASFNNINEGTSNFDPVLAELMYKWFNVPNGRVLDPFGGEQTKGIVAGVLGYPYAGCEIRQEQVDYNRGICGGYPSTEYFCGDSNNIDTIVPNVPYDMVFTSPPYYDLEVYSASDLSALPTYTAFMEQMANIYGKCATMLNWNRFFVVKVGEIRDKNGVYRNFVGDTVTMLRNLGLNYYNEIILLNSVGTGSMRASGSFRNRKIVKLHQNLLVFYKGNPDSISSLYTNVDSGLPINNPAQDSLF